MYRCAGLLLLSSWSLVAFKSITCCCFQVDHLLLSSWSLLYAAVLSNSALVACDSKWVTVAFYSMFLSNRRSGVPTALIVTLLVPLETAVVSVHVLCTPYNHAPVSLLWQFMQSHIDACVFSCILPPAYFGRMTSDDILDFFPLQI